MKYALTLVCVLILSSCTLYNVTIKTEVDVIQDMLNIDFLNINLILYLYPMETKFM